MTALIPQIAKPLRNDVIIPKNRRRVKIKKRFFFAACKTGAQAADGAEQSSENSRGKMLMGDSRISAKSSKRSPAPSVFRKRAYPINNRKTDGRQAPAVGFAVRFSNVLPRLSACLMNKRRDLPFSAASKLKFSDGLREAGGGKRMAGCYSKHLVKQKFTKEC